MLWIGRLASSRPLVTGTHGLSGFERFMVASVAEKVLRKASCPVMTGPAGDGNSRESPLYAVALSGGLLRVFPVRSAVSLSRSPKSLTHT